MRAFTDYAHKRFKRLIDQINFYDPSQRTETLHTIRLEIKKIKALINLTNFCVKGFKAHGNFVPFRTIFRMAGVIRQTDLYYELLLHYQIEGVKDELIPESNNQSKHISAFRRNSGRFITTIYGQEKKLIRYFKKIRRDDFEKYLKKRKIQSQKKLYPKLVLNELHKTRKRIKEILYLSSITKKTKKKLDPFFNRIQIMIGYRHDKQMLIPLLGNNWTEVKRLKAECRADLGEIERVVSGYYGRA